MIGITSRENLEYLKSLGVHEVIDYKREDEVTGVDALIDLVGGETLSRSYSVMKKGGVLATTVQPIDESAAKRAGIRTVHVVMKRNAADLSELTRLVQEGAFKPRVS